MMSVWLVPTLVEFAANRDRSRPASWRRRSLCHFAIAMLAGNHFLLGNFAREDENFLVGRIVSIVVAIVAVALPEGRAKIEDRHRWWFVGALFPLSFAGLLVNALLNGDA